MLESLKEKWTANGYESIGMEKMYFFYSNDDDMVNVSFIAEDEDDAWRKLNKLLSGSQSYYI